MPEQHGIKGKLQRACQALPPVLRLAHTPNDVGLYTVDEVDRRVISRPFSLQTGIPTVDGYMKPVMPGEVIFVEAFTSNGKTAFMQFWSRSIVKQLDKRPTTKDVVVYVSWETLVEELGLYDLCGMTGIDASAAWYGNITKQEQADLRLAACQRACMPIWVLGHSLKRRREQTDLTLSAVRKALFQMEETYNVRPAIIFLDYLQIITPETGGEDRRIQVMRSVDAIQRMARDCGAPVVVGCQAGRQVMGREFKLPEIGDGQETSRIEQDADKVLALWYPCKSESMGAMIIPLNLAVSERLMVMGIRKQRHAASGQVFPLDFDAAHNTFATWNGAVEG